MLSDFFFLGLKPDATDQQIRKTYLELVKRYPPETEPETFSLITAAYERIKNQRVRVKSQLFDGMKNSDALTSLKSMLQTQNTTPKSAGLADLLDSL
jgi:curved DNA-binding protein CbpA